MFDLFGLSDSHEFGICVFLCKAKRNFSNEGHSNVDGYELGVVRAESPLCFLMLRLKCPITRFSSYCRFRYLSPQAQQFGNANQVSDSSAYIYSAGWQTGRHISE